MKTNEINHSFADNELHRLTANTVNSDEINIFLETDDQSLCFPLSISLLANAAATSIYTIRNYVDEGLLNCCEKTSAGYGRYDQCALNRLRLIRIARSAGLLIIDIKPLLKTLNDNDKNTRDDVLRTLQSKITIKQDYLQLLDSQLSNLERLE